MRRTLRFIAMLGAVLASTASCNEAAKTKPYHDRPHTIPGTIEAEDYDRGGAEQAYHDIDKKNHGADYRGETQVDIEKRSDASNGYGIGWTQKEEWILYTVKVKESGMFDIEIPVASDKKGGQFHLEFNGKDATGPIQVPDTGGWHRLKVVKIPGVQLERGTYEMKMVMDSEGPSGSVGDIDLLRFVKRTP